MAQIPAWLWILAGLAVTITSAYIGDLQLFLYAGLAFFAFGVFKLLTAWVTAKPITKEEKKEFASRQHKMVYCRHCRTTNWSTANYCHNCGARLR